MHRSMPFICWTLIVHTAAVQPIIIRPRSPLPLLGGVGPDALACELEDGGMMDEAVDGGHRGHGIIEDLIPLGKDQVGGDDDGFNRRMKSSNTRAPTWRVWVFGKGPF
jgi:hypothetical protein